MNDFFGYTRHNPGQFVYSSDYSSVYFANTRGGATNESNRAGLVQSAAVSYQHRVEPRFEAGSSELYWCTGQSSGAVQMGRLVGDRGFLEGIRAGRAGRGMREKGVLGTVEFKAGTVNVDQDVLTLGGCVLQGVAFSTSVGALEISEALTVQVAVMEKKNLGMTAGLLQGVLGSIFG